MLKGTVVQAFLRSRSREQNTGKLPMNGQRIVVALIRLAGIQAVWSAFWNLTYVSEYKARYVIEAAHLPTTAEISLMALKMVLFRGALSIMFGLTLLMFAQPLAQRLMKTDESAGLDAASRAGRGESDPAALERD